MVIWKISLPERPGISGDLPIFEFQAALHGTVDQRDKGRPDIPLGSSPVPTGEGKRVFIRAFAPGDRLHAAAGKQPALSVGQSYLTKVSAVIAGDAGGEDVYKRQGKSHF